MALPLRIRDPLSIELHIGVLVLFLLGAAQAALPIGRSASFQGRGIPRALRILGKERRDRSFRRPELGIT